MILVNHLGFADITSLVFGLVTGSLAGIFVYRIVLKHLLAADALPLNGPSNKSKIFGVMHEIQSSPDPGKLYEDWAAAYGPVYKVPTLFGRSKIVLLDPKALSQFYAKETTVYVGAPSTKRFIARIFGKGLLWAEGESHKRQRRALTPAFSNAALRRLTSVFYDSAYKLKSYWDNELENNPDGDVIEVQHWMNRVALDSLGIAGFSHNFESLEGKRSAIGDAFEALGRAPPTKLSGMIFLLQFVFPWAGYIPTERNVLLLKMKRTMKEIANEMLEKNKKVEESSGGGDKSIIGLLIKAENTSKKGDGDNKLHMTAEEVAAQMNVLLVAGYETTSISLTWALIELSKSLAKQDLLRKELLGTNDGHDPEWDDLMTADKYPYLDAVVHETLRLHPPVAETTRMASETDVLPLSMPIITKDGKELTSLPVAKGTHLTSPISCLNRSELVWGKRAKEFIPERWIAGNHGFEESEVIPASAKSIQGHRHLLTFSDGPRICLGRNFALSEFKAVLFVLIRNYSFEFPNGPDTKISIARALLPRPTVEGSQGLGPKVPLRVRKVEAE